MEFKRKEIVFRYWIDKSVFVDCLKEFGEFLDGWVCISEDANPTAQEVAYGIKKELGL